MEPEGYADAVLIENGIIAAVGGREQLRAWSRGAAEIDLAGRALLPAFIDAHSHFSGAANALLQAPLDEAADWAELCGTLTRFIADNRIAKGQWVVGKGYDHNALAERRHPTREALDRAAPDNPVMIVHQSGHMGVFNSLALRLLGVTSETEAPAGGRIACENGAPTGYMEENAFLFYQQKTPMPAPEDLLDAYRRVQELYASHGVATVQEGMMPAALIPLYKELLSRDLLKLDVVGYPGVPDAEAVFNAFPEANRRYQGHFKLGGCKLFLDGSPQGRTAWMRTPYLGGERDYRGYGTMRDDAVREALEAAYRAGMQPLAHCNGDAAAAQYLAAVAAIEREWPDFRGLRPVMIHAQLLDVDQMDEAARLGVIPSFFIAHVYHWGDVHIRNFGAERAGRISAAKAALDRNIPFTFHQDTPVLPPDMLETVWCAVNRLTKDGVLLGGGQRIPAEAALRAVTINAAHQYFEEARKGSLRPGKAADLVLLDADPLSVPPDRLRNIRVLETIKAGETVYRA
ncbi:MAG: amidohydrolase [Eubacteriales bacterium]|nr:amidohydrolase [Eubacteriales bacterium]